MVRIDVWEQVTGLMDKAALVLHEGCSLAGVLLSSTLPDFEALRWAIFPADASLMATFLGVTYLALGRRLMSDWSSLCVQVDGVEGLSLK